MKENSQLEFKEAITNTFLKTVSAYANYQGGKILFGVDDSGNVKGLDHPEDAALSIENKINDSISPQPDYCLTVNKDNTIALDVQPGIHPPYLYKSKAYRRNDTATIEADPLALRRLILAGENINFEQLPSSDKNLSFQNLEAALKEKLQIESLSLDVQKTLDLYTDKEGYNQAAAILSDQNHFPGIDVAKFEHDISIIRKRDSIRNISCLEVYKKGLGLYRDYYQYEEISGSERGLIETIPEVAFREALANAIIHRTWDTANNIRVSMFDDRVEICSPGGLPAGISREEYLSGRTSILRNPILANVFYRLGLVEIFGTGILRINQTYETSLKKPEYIITDNTITIILPVLQNKLFLQEDEEAVYQLLQKNRPMYIGEIMRQLPFGRSKVTRILKSLIKDGYIKVEGNGRGTKYRKV